MHPELHTAAPTASRPRGGPHAHAAADGPVLLERGAEQQAITAALAAAARGVGRLLVVEGEPGLGKTRLLGLARAQARRAGAPAALVHAAPAESGIPHAVARRLVEALLVGSRGRRPEPAPAAPAEPADAPPFLRVVAELARHGPVLLALDDAHACDRASLRFIDTIVHRMGSLPVVVVLARRPGAASGVQVELDELTRRADVVTLRLAPLSPRGTTRLAREVIAADAPELAAAAHRATGGNPFLLDALLGAVRQDGRDPEAVAAHLAELLPDALRRWSQHRLAGVDLQERALLEAAAVLGERAALDDVAQVVRRPEPVVQDAAAALARRGLLRTTEPMALAPPLLGWVLLEELDPVERVALHTAAASVLAADGRVLDAAPHLLEIPPDEEDPQLDRLRDAARAARERGDLPLAVQLLRRALEEPLAAAVRPELLLELGAALILARPRAAGAVLREAVQDPRTAGDATLLLAEAHRFAGRDADADALLIDLARRTPLQAAARDAALALWRPLWDRTARRPGAQEDPPLPPGAPQDRMERMLVVARALDALGRSAPADDVANALEPALAEGVLTGEPLLLDLHLVQALPVLAACGRPEVALAHADRALADPRLARAAVLTAFVRAARAAVLLHRDRLEEAAADACAALPVLAEHAPAFVGLALDPAVRARLAQGRLAEAAALTARAPAADAAGDAGGLAALARARTALAGGHPRRGVEALLGARDGLAEPAANESVTPLLADAIDALVAVEEDRRAYDLSRTLLAAQRRFGEPRGLGLALRAAAAVAHARRDRRQLLEQAADALLQAGAHVERAEVLVRLALVLEEDDRSAEARDALTEAVRVAASGGAGRIEGLAASRLVALGGRPRAARPRPTTPLPTPVGVSPAALDPEVP